MTEDYNELEELKQKADLMGIKYHPAIGADKLREKINAELEPMGTLPKVAETPEAYRVRKRMEANKLVRVRLTCMNPNKKDWPGEFISVSNRLIGTIKKFIPFETEDGYHIPQILLDELKERKYRMSKTVTVGGKKVKKNILSREFAIEILPELTVEELKDLAHRQAINA